jgi:hypothetical protein
MMNSTTTRMGITSLSIAAILLTASLVSIGMMQTNASAAPVTIFERHLTGEYAIADGSIQEGTLVTYATASAFETTSGGTEICVSISEYDTSIESFINYFYGCGPADDETIAGNLGSATYSASSITLVDPNTGEERIVDDVSVDLTATVKVQRGGYTLHERDVYNNQIIVEHGNSVYRQASGSLNIISGGFTFSTDDANGIIARTAEGNVLLRFN